MILFLERQIYLNIQLKTHAILFEKNGVHLVGR